MKSIQSGILVILTAVWLTPGITAAEIADSASDTMRAEGFWVGYRSCSENEFDEDRLDIRTDQSAVVWESDGEGNLYLTYLNSAFNCCPDLKCEITVDSNVITVRQAEVAAGDGVCLYDVDYMVTGLTHGYYWVRFDELYIQENDEQIEFRAVVNKPSSNIFIAYRNHDPWQSDGTPWVKLLSDLEQRKLGEIFLYNPPTEGNCILWDYNDNILRLQHRGAGMVYFDLRVGVDITVSNKVLVLEEYTYRVSTIPTPISTLKNLMLDMRIYNLPPKDYHLIIHGPGGPFETTLDLPYVPTGYDCLEEY